MKKFILIAAAALLALSCFFEDEPTTEPPTYPEATSPANVLKNVEISFNQRNAGLLDGVLSKAFVFYFDPDDVGQNPPGSHYIIPESWSYTEFWQAVESMFNKAYSISLTIPTASVGKPGPEETTYDAENINIKILVMVDEVNGYLGNNGYCNFRFERYDGSGGTKLWRLAGWWDNTSASGDANPGVAPTSLGRVLALYR